MTNAQLYFLEELKGIEAGMEKAEVGSKTLEMLVGAYNKFEFGDISFGIDEHRLTAYISEKRIDYTEKDIADLVHWAGVQELRWDESLKIGKYIGSLISILTEKNEKEGKRTVIDIKENRLYFLGERCRKFDVVKIGVNYGGAIFRYAEGERLYVEKCEGGLFANDAKVGKIVAGEVNGVAFAVNSNVGTIVAREVNGKGFAYSVKADKIVTEKVDGENFAGNAEVGIIVAGNINGDVFASGARVGQIVRDSEEAKREYKKAMREIADLEGSNDNTC
jgi:hypothetical protein